MCASPQLAVGILWQILRHPTWQGALSTLTRKTNTLNTIIHKQTCNNITSSSRITSLTSVEKIMRLSRSSWVTLKKQVANLKLVVLQVQHQEWSRWRSSFHREKYQALFIRQSKLIVSSKDLMVIYPQAWWITWSIRNRQVQTRTCSTLTSLKAVTAQILPSIKCSIKTTKR